MSKLLFLGTFIPAAFLLLGSLLFPNNTIMWFASDSVSYNVIVLALSIFAGGLLFATLFSQHFLRALAALFAIGLLVWTVMSVYQDTMQLLNALCLIEIAIISAIASVERTPEPEFALSFFELRSLFRIYTQRLETDSVLETNSVELPTALVKKTSLRSRISKRIKELLQGGEMPKAQQT